MTLLRKLLEAGLDDPRALAASFIKQTGEFAKRTLKRGRDLTLKL